mmetsp:Transcript_34144/g.74840  ORF Transcript_34144/g.74840 Transcript_34144/m.74840 type:complete len:251 (+) Transcript_34144:175-927(+)
MAYHGAQSIHDDAQCHQGGNVCVIIRRTDFDDLHATQAFLGHEANQLEGFTGQEATGFRPPGARHKGRFDGINVIAHVDSVAPIPSSLERHFGDLINAKVLDVVHSENIGFTLNHIGNSRTGYLPPSNTDLDEILRIYVWQVGCMEIGSGMHAFVEILLLNVGMTVDMDNTNIFCSDGCQTPDGRKADRMIASKNDGHGTLRGNMGHGVGDLIETLLNIGGDSEDITNVTEGHLLAQVNTLLVVVGRIES